MWALIRINGNEPELRPEFVKRMAEISKQRSIKVYNFGNNYLKPKP